MTHRSMYARPALGFAPSDEGYLRQDKATAEMHTSVCVSPSTQYWHNTVPSDGGYLRQDKATAEMHTSVCVSPSTQYWHNTVPSDGGYLRQGKATGEAHTLCMCKPFNAVLAQHHSL